MRGTDWPPRARDMVKAWLSGEECRPELVRDADRFLRAKLGDLWVSGYGEEAWHDYNLGRIDRHLTAYDPDEAPFERYLPHYFRFFCRDWAKVIRRRGGKEVVPDETSEGAHDDAAPPSSAADAVFRYRELLDRMARCVTALELRVVILHKAHGYPFAEIGGMIGKSEVATRVLHHRAWHRLWRCLGEDGYLP